MREECGLTTKLNRHQRKKNRLNRQHQQGGVGSGADEQQPTLAKPSIRAIIASGTGPDGQAEARKLRKRRRMQVRAVVVVAVSVLVALARNYYYFSGPTQQPQFIDEERSGSNNVAARILSPLLPNDLDAVATGEESSAATTTMPDQTIMSDEAEEKINIPKETSSTDSCANNEVSC